MDRPRSTEQISNEKISKKKWRAEKGVGEVGGSEHTFVMGRRLRILLGSSIGAGIGAGLYLLFLIGREEVYEGKPFSFWLQEYSHSWMVDDTRFAKSEEAIRKIGTNGLPQLVRMIEAQDNPVKVKAAAVFNRYSPKKWKIISAQEKRGQAVMGFQVLGLQAKPAIPELGAVFQREDLLQRNDFPQEVFLALAFIGPDSIPVLSPLLTNRYPALRAGAARALGGLMPSEVVVVNIQKLLSDGNPQVRSSATVAFSNLHTDSAMPALIAGLQDPDAEVRYMSAYALGRYGKKAESAAPALERAASDPQSLVREAAKEALEGIQAPAK